MLDAMHLIAYSAVVATARKRQRWLMDVTSRLAFVSMTNMLLISSLVSLMSMSLEGVRLYWRISRVQETDRSPLPQVMSHAREEYLFQ